MAKRTKRSTPPASQAAASRSILPQQGPPVARGRTADPLRRPFATLQATPGECTARCSRLSGLARQLCVQQCLQGRLAV